MLIDWHRPEKQRPMHLNQFSEVACVDKAFSKRFHRLIVVLSIIAVVCGLYIWQVSSSRRSPVTTKTATVMKTPFGPVSTVTANVASLPTTVTTKDAKVTLTRIDRYTPDSIAITIDIDAISKTLQVFPERITASVNGKSTENNSNGSRRNGNDKSAVEMTGIPKINKVDRYIDVFCAFQTCLPDGSKKLSFKDVDPSTLPITQTDGPVSLTLEQAVYGKTPKGYLPYTDHHHKFLVITYSETGPADNFRNTVELQKGGWSIDSTSSDPYWMVDSSASVSDESGKVLDHAAGTREDVGRASDAFEKAIDRRSLLESAVGKVSSRTASRMITKRAMSEAMSSTRTCKVAEYFIADHAPKRITWEPIINLTPKVRNRQLVVFKNVPIPPK